MKVDREKIVMFRVAQGLMIAMVEDEKDLESGRFIELHAPRSIVINQNPQSGAMQMTFVPYAIISTKTFLSEFIDNTNFKVMFNTDKIECIIPKNDISNTLCNNYLATLTSIIIPSALNGNISQIQG